MKETTTTTTTNCTDRNGHIEEKWIINCKIASMINENGKYAISNQYQ